MPGPLIATLVATLLLAAAAAPAAAQGTFVNWASPPVHPVDMTPDGSTLLVVNTADARLTLGAGLPVHTASVPVGLDPVSVRAQVTGGQCGDVRFPGPAPATCRIRHAGTRLICGG